MHSTLAGDALVWNDALDWHYVLRWVDALGWYDVLGMDSMHSVVTVSVLNLVSTESTIVFSLKESFDSTVDDLFIFDSVSTKSTILAE